MKKIIILIAILSNLVSCARLDFGLQFFSFYIKSEVDDMFDLNTPQKDLFEKNFSTELEKAKRDRFPIYADYLESISQAIESTNLTGEKVSQLFDQGSELFLQTPPQWKTALEEVVLTLKVDQFKVFEEYFYTKIEKQKDRSKTLKSRQKQQLKAMQKWIDESIEDLTSTQEKKLEQYIKTNPKPFELSIKSQEFVFSQFKEAFPEVNKRQIFIQTFLTDWRTLQLPDYVKAHELYLVKLKDYVMDLSLNLNEKQKNNLIRNLKKRALELRKISIQSEAE